MSRTLTALAIAVYVAVPLLAIPTMDTHPARSLLLLVFGFLVLLAVITAGNRRAARRRERERQAHAEQVQGWDVEPYVIGTQSGPAQGNLAEWRWTSSTWPEISAHAADRSTENGVEFAYVERHHPDGSVTTWTWRAGSFVGEERGQRDTG